MHRASLLRSLSAACALLALAACGRSGARPAAPPVQVARCPDCNLVLISIDTLRADHLGCYGYERDTSPHIDAFARESALFERAYSASYHTAESHMSVFTSTYPSVHRVRNVSGNSKARSLSPEIETVTEVLHAAGYHTVGLHGGGNVSPQYGFNRGFDLYKRVTSVDPVVEWVRTKAAAHKFFLFFHTYRVHDPYTPPPPYNQLYDPGYKGDIIGDADELASLVQGDTFADVRKVFWGRVNRHSPADIRHLEALYDGGINRVDEEIGRLLAALQEVAPHTVIALMSDHGEEFLEHGRFIHDQLYNELLHVPLIVHNPDQPRGGQRLTERASLVDLAPTLLDLLALPPLPQAQGTSLAQRLNGGDDAPRDILSEKMVGPTPASPGRNVSLIVGDRKLILESAGSRVELYDLSTDPRERHNLADDRGATADLLREVRALKSHNALLAGRLNPAGSEAEAPLDEEEVKQLRALGYVK